MKGKWIKSILCHDKLFSWKYVIKRFSAYNYCLAFFFVNEGKVDGVQVWDDEQSTFIEKLPKKAFKDKSIDEMKRYIETILRMEGTI